MLDIPKLYSESKDIHQLTADLLDISRDQAKAVNTEIYLRIKRFEKDIHAKPS